MKTVKKSFMKNLLLPLGIALAFSSCRISADDIRFEEVNRVEVQGITLSQMRLDLGMGMVNDSRVKITVQEGELTVSDPQGDIAQITLREAVTLPKRSAVEVTLPVSIRFRGALGIAGVLPRLQGDADKLKVRGFIRAKGGGVNRKFEISDMPLQVFLNSIGIKDLKSLNLPL